MMLIAPVLLLALLVTAAGYDLAFRRIPNWLVVCGMVTGFLCSVLAPEGTGLFMQSGGGLGGLHSMLGILAGGLLLLLPYLVGAMGAGDVKLVAALGAFFGPVQIFGAALLTFLAGGLMAFVVACMTGTLRQVIDNLRLMVLFAVVGRGSGMKVSDAPTSGRLPYALAILSGSVLQIYMARFTDWPLV